uniref:Retrotransposon Copia-like N-terminal domain-containing protein n=1 Tax=Populus alba TaxID=43335 RepID=A0A4U5NRV7_POPAL|nr:hypothetical protein D5086_0000246950 [Populus alba]
MQPGMDNKSGSMVLLSDDKLGFKSNENELRWNVRAMRFAEKEEDLVTAPREHIPVPGEQEFQITDKLNGENRETLAEGCVEEGLSLKQALTNEVNGVQIVCIEDTEAIHEDLYYYAITKDSGAVMEDHFKDAIDIGSKVSTLANCSDDNNTSQRLSSMLLNEFNYLPWSRAVTIALGGRSKLGFINGSIIPPEVDDPEYAAWLSKDQLVMSWILNSMERNLAEIFSFS